MLEEYAVEPNTLPQTWQRFIYVIEKFGFDRGRLISCMPQEWLKEVEVAIEGSEFSEIQRKKADEKLLWAKRHAVSVSKRQLNPAIGNWYQNAIVAQQNNRLKAVLAAENPATHASVIRFDELTDDHALFGAPNSWEVPRNTAGITTAVAPFLKESKAVFLVDPFFHGGQNGSNYTDPLVSILDYIGRYGVKSMQFQIHFKTTYGNPNLNDYEANAGAWFAGVIPDGLSIVLYEWTEKTGGVQFHDRHLLTERGGITLGAGFCSVNDTTNLGVTLMGVEDSRQKFERFLPRSNAYNAVGAGLRISSDGRAKRI